MLSRSFCQLSGVGPKTERKLWDRGVHSWDALEALDKPPLPPLARSLAADGLAASRRALAARDAPYFSERLPAAEAWRLYPAFADGVAYVDIETTGLSPVDDHITSVALYDGAMVRTFVHGQDLDAFADAMVDRTLLVTFNGKCFDVPILEKQLHLRLPRAHIDLRYVLNSLGYRGGLKAIERTLGIDRDALDGVDGVLAVMLWHEYVRAHDEQALETLRAYNAADVIHLERLLVHAVNQKLTGTPFYEELSIEPPPTAANPHAADPAIVARYRDRFAAGPAFAR